MIYTTYFAMFKYLPENIVPVSISLYHPKWYNGLEYKVLSPTDEILNKWKNLSREVYSQEDYIDQYSIDVLEYLNPHKVEEDLYRISNGKDVAIICFEAPYDFCHRHLDRWWFNNDKIDCQEWLREPGITVWNLQ